LVKWQYLHKQADFVAPVIWWTDVRLRQGLDCRFQNGNWVILLNTLRRFTSISWCIRQRTKDKQKCVVEVPKTRKHTKWICQSNWSIKEALWDVEEGADMVMVNPELPI
jgi:hypothetical protein